MLGKSLMIGAVLAAGLAFARDAQAQYVPYPYYQAPAAPQSWSYDPYTSGLGPCPQRRPSDEQCRYTMPPTAGQPSYWPNQ